MENKQPKEFLAWELGHNKTFQKREQSGQVELLQVQCKPEQRFFPADSIPGKQGPMMTHNVY